MGELLLDCSVSYLKIVTDSIVENLNGSAITITGPSDLEDKKYYRPNLKLESMRSGCIE